MTADPWAWVGPPAPAVAAEPAPEPEDDAVSSDPWPKLDARQRAELVAAAEKRGMEVDTFLVDHLLRHKVISPSKARKRTVAQLENRAPAP